MRLALLSAEYPPMPGGVGDYTRRLGEALLQIGHEVTIITGSGPAANTSMLPVIRIAEAGWGWGCWPAILSILQHLKPDVLHIQYQTGAYAMHPAINLLPWRLRRIPGRPIIAVTAHDLLLPYLFPKAGPLRGWITRKFLRDANGVIVTNASDRRQAIQWGLPEPIVIPIGSNIPVAPPENYDRATWRATQGIQANETLIAYFGLISPTKGLDTLLDALEHLPAYYRVLVIGGEATAPQDRMFAETIRRRIASGLAARVTITGHCDEPIVSAHLLAADLAALPFVDGASFRRGSLLAALAHGVPVVTTFPESGDPGDHGQQLCDGKNALLTAPADATALAAAIWRSGEDSALRHRLGMAGQDLAGHFSWEVIARHHTEWYGRLHRSLAH